MSRIQKLVALVLPFVALGFLAAAGCNRSDHTAAEPNASNTEPTGMGTTANAPGNANPGGPGSAGQTGGAAAR